MISEYRNKIIRNLRRKYLFALGFLSVLTVLSFLFFIYSIRTTDKDGYMINLSGKQRFFAQHVTFHALLFVANPNSQHKDSLRNILINSIRDMETGHTYLTRDSVSLPSYYHSPAIDSVYFSAPVSLDKKVDRFLEEAYLLAGAKEGEISISNPHLRYLLNSSTDLIASLNLIVYQYQKENEKEVQKLFYQKIIITLSLLLSYLLVGIFIFRPMTKEINRNLTDLENKENELQQINEAHIAANFEAQENERQRIASDLHDGLIQTLTTISYKFANAGKNYDQEQKKYFHELKSSISNVIAETRNIAYSILPPILRQFGIIPALKSLSEQVRAQNNINVVFQTYELEGRLDDKLELALYRIAQEALSNAAKHAEAKNVKIQLINHPGMLVLIIEDDGKGFDISDRSNSKGMGLVNIQNRINMFHGNFILNSSPDLGTEIMVEIPLQDNIKA